ncbi:alkaline phosphatase D family protein [Jejudonia soesokkakensis]|uniref:Alkaline phosphatase D family protein n=1 Tax=Jejudonia soesokkakensis TaxID=1323432 RepID=A0ABW2MVF3_9FLAO
MKKMLLLFTLVLLICCKPKPTEASSVENILPTLSESEYDYTIVFGSCNDQDRPQPLWKPILENSPSVFIWGGDNVYADTANMQKMEADYDKVWANSEYQELADTSQIIGIWDDHDYGKNDAGIEWEKKEEAQTLLLDFLKVPENDIRRSQEGVYTSHFFNTKRGSIKVILLDTRYFRTELNPSDVEGRRYDSWEASDAGSVLGDRQWKWLEKELEEASADFTMIVSSIQFLADEHGWEKWGNYPSEVQKMYTVLQNAKASNIFFVSGDRHQGEVSVNKNAGLAYSLVDFTSSGLTHTFPGDPMDSNRYRVGDGTKDLNFGVFQFDFDTQTVLMELRGIDNTLIQEFKQTF